MEENNNQNENVENQNNNVNNSIPNNNVNNSIPNNNVNNSIPNNNANNVIDQSVSKNNNNKMLIALLILIIVGLLGYLVYDKFIRTDDIEKTTDKNIQETENKNNETENNNENNSKQNEQESTNNENNSKQNEQESTNNENNNDSNSTQNNETSNIKLEGLTFKTSDGKNALKIVSKNDKEALSKAKEMSAYEFMSNDIDYLGYYNGKIMLLFYDGIDLSANNSKYVVLGGKNDDFGQCRDSNGFIINVVNNTLVNLSKGSIYKVHKVGEKYYFSEGDCALTFLPIGVYDESLKKIGYYYLNSDSNENIYVLDDGENGSIVKYDKNGAIVKKTNQKFSNHSINSDNLSYGDTLYIIAYIDSKLYLVDVSTEEKYILNGLDDEFAGITDDMGPIAMTVNNDVIEISRDTQEFDEQKNEYINKNEVVYTFNPATKTLTQK